jgi:glycosyltransferase involved in cell wall biosynthesis
MPVSVEHIVQDAGSRGIAAFAREIAASLKKPFGADEKPAEFPSEILHLVTPTGYTLRLISEPDAGMYDAINRGLRRTTGNYCAYLNCDEQYLPGALGRVGAFYDSHPETDVLFGDVVLVDADGTPLACRRILVPTRLHTRFVHLATLSCATFFRATLIEKGFYFDPAWKVIGDGVWMSRLLDAGFRMAALKTPLSAFALTGSNLGDTTGDAAEGERWTSLPDAPPRWMKVPVTIAHRLRRLLGGAQLPRRVRVKLYTPTTPAERHDFGDRILSARWPKGERVGGKG